MSGGSLLKRLALAHAGDGSFTGIAAVGGADRVFGGTVVAQALMAGFAVEADGVCHSLHAYFLTSGAPAVPITYRVSPLRAGRRFSVLQVDASQDGRRIAFVTLSIQRGGGGPGHQAAPPEGVPPPEAFDDSDDRGAAAGVRLRNVDGRRALPGRDPSIHRTWFRSDQALGDDPRAHQIAFTYASDFPPLSAVLKPHDALRDDPGLFFASLDHAIWFHRPIDFGRWLLCDMRATVSGDRRGLAAGGVFTRDGVQVASLAQEGYYCPMDEPS